MLTDEQRRALSRAYRFLLSLPDTEVCRESDEAYDETQTGEESGLETVASPALDQPAQEAGNRRITNE